MVKQDSSNPDPKSLAAALAKAVEDVVAVREGDAPGAPLVRLTTAVGKLPAGLRELRRQAAEQRIAHLETRTEIVSRPLQEQRQRLEKGAELRAAELAAPIEDGFVVYGRVVDAESGGGLAGVRVQAFDNDPLHDDLLGEVRTDDLGFYRLEYRRKDFGDHSGRPETYVRIYDQVGGKLYTSDRNHKADPVEEINAAVDAGKVPRALEQGRLYARQAAAALVSVERELRTHDSRLAVLAGRVGSPPAGSRPAGSPPVAEAAPPVTAVKGVGRKLTVRLDREGVADAAELADMKLSRLTGILKIASGRADKIRHEARRLLDRDD